MDRWSVATERRLKCNTYPKLKLYFPHINESGRRHQIYLIHKKWVTEYRIVREFTSVTSMSDAGDDVQVEAPEVEVAVEAPKGKLTIEEALQVCGLG